MLSDDFLYQLRQNSPIDSVMSSYTRLTKRGRNFVCLCPFHSEKSPSCTVYPETASFYCFGCGAGGDVITFIKRIENLEYIEAVRFLAERAGLTMPEDNVDNEFLRKKTRTLEANRAAANFFFSQLKTRAGEKGLRYIVARGLTPQTVQKYGLGYALDSWTALGDYLTRSGFTAEELVVAGLCGKSAKTGRIYDLFRDRVMFPIVDLRGNVIAFGGRILDGEGPKYLNSSDTPVFKKSRNLFSLNFAKTVKDKRLILAEGYMDVISINQAGFENVVATLGTSLTSEQARLMSQYAKEVIIAYDSDNAGQAATAKAINLLDEAGVSTKIIKMDGAKDPDEYIKKFGAIRFKNLLDNSDGAVAFQLKKCKDGLDTDSDLGKVEYLKRAVKLISGIASPVERDIYLSRIANEQGVSKEVLQAQVGNISKKQRSEEGKKEWQDITAAAIRGDRRSPEATQFPRESKAEMYIISYLLRHSGEVDEVAKRLPSERFVTAFNRRIYEKLVERGGNGGDFSLSTLADEFTMEEMGKISEMLAKTGEISISEREVDDCIAILNDGERATAEGFSDDDLLRLAEALKNKNRRTTNEHG